MSAPTTHDPLVVTTTDGVTWLRRAVVEGRGLYAVTDSCNCPEYLMATLAELAEHGIAGAADALPMPVGPEPRSALDQARDDIVGACLARWEEEQVTARLRLALASAQRGRRELRARVAELEARPSQDEVAKWLWKKARECPTDPARREDAAEAIARLADKVSRGAIRPAAPYTATPEAHAQMRAALRDYFAGAKSDGITQRVAPTQTLREDPQDGPLHHDYRVCRDLPETGGA